MKASTGFNYTSEELMEFARRDDTEIREICCRRCLFWPYVCVAVVYCERKSEGNGYSNPVDISLPRKFSFGFHEAAVDEI